MKPLLILFMTTVAFACKKEEQPALAEQPVMKEVAYHIFADSDYNGTSNQNTTADLRLQIRIINYQTGDQQIVWDSIFTTRRLPEFSLYSNKVVIKKSFPVLNSHQKLNGSFSVVYRNNGLIWQRGLGEDAGPGTEAVLLEANL